MRRAFVVTATAALVLALLAPTASSMPTGSLLPAFPGAEGFGAAAVGGRGGDVYIVTTLADDGPGSLREGLEQAVAPRTIVFEVAGEIELQSPLRFSGSHLTLAGQTSPGGVTVSGYPTEIVNSSHVVVRYLRFRTGDRNAAGVTGRPGKGNADLVGDAGDALSILRSHHVMVDHVSASWGMDETLSVTKSGDVTVQHSIISESLDDSYHSEGRHGYGSLVRGTGSRGYSFIGNLWAHHQRRMPAIGGQQDPPAPGETGAGLDLDLVNNVMYDWRLFASHVLAEPHDLRVNLVGNLYLAGPSLELCACPWANWETGADQLRVHRDGNLVDSAFDGVVAPEPMQATDFLGPVTFEPSPFDFARPAIASVDAVTAALRTVFFAGASIDRDLVDQRIAIQTFFSLGGVIDSQDDVGGWPEITARPAPVDLDRDGMADAWELTMGLDPSDPDDHAGHDLDPGYTNLERYLDALTARGAD